MIAIVIVAYNRPEPLKRLLDSVSKGIYPDESIDLIISIDKSDNENIEKIAHEFVWSFGQKTIIQHESRLGLKKHILSCGDLTYQYENIILLEDDLVVSPAFYLFAKKVIGISDQKKQICGYALYSPTFNEVSFINFQPLNAGSDYFLMKVPCSWGQIWTREQWHDFKLFYVENNSIEDILPPTIASWPSEKSWKKYFYSYMIKNNKYFLYPYLAFSTTLGDPGENLGFFNSSIIAPLTLSNNLDEFGKNEKDVIYFDEYFEIETHSLKKLAPQLAEYDFTVDIYGSKNLKNFNCTYAISLKTTSKAILSYDFHYYPFELNLIYNCVGFFFSLAHKDSFEDIEPETRKIFIRGSDYHQFQKAIQDSYHKGLNNGIKMASETFKKSLSFRIGQLILFPFSYIRKVFKKV